jgi:KAP family P-loop domain
VSDPIRPTPGDSESSESRIPAPSAEATDGQRNNRSEVVETSAGNADSVGKMPAAGKPSRAASRFEPVTSPAPQPSALTVLADVPLADRTTDGLGFLAYADALCGLIDNPVTPTPLTIAVSAAWGAGKTSLVNLVTSQLAERTRRRRGRQHIVCVFPAWLHDDAPHLGAALAAKVAREANRYRAWPRRLASPLPSAMLTAEQRWRRRIVIGCLSLIVAVLALLPASVRMSINTTTSFAAVISDIVGQRWAPLGLLMLAALAIWPKVFASAQAAARFVDDPKSEASTGSMWQVREQLGRLIRQAIRNPGLFGKWVRRTWPRIAQRLPRYRQERRRLVLIIDDLERCRPPRAIDVCEVASQLLGHQDVVTIIIADMATLAMSAEIRYAALETVPTSQGHAAEGPFAIQPTGAYGRLYLEKMVQIQFDLPPPSSTGLRSMLAGSVGEEDTQVRHATGKRNLSEAFALFVFIARLAGKWGILAALVVVGIVAAVVGPLVGPVGAVVASVAAVLVLLAASFVAVLWLERRTEQQAQGTNRSDLPSLLGTLGIAAMGLLVGPVSSALAEPILALVTAVAVRLRQDKEERRITDESEERKQGEAAILKFLAPDDVPRRAKRMVNHLRLLLLVADKRKMFGGVPPLNGAHLGKWIVLLERWPELGRALRADPGVMAVIEEVARTDQRALQDVLQRIAPDVIASADLAGFLQDETKLAGLIRRLIYYLPSWHTVEVGDPA